MKRVDLRGQRFGLLVVLRVAGRNRWKRLVWRCRCACGRSHIASSNNLRRGKIKSCGCDRGAAISRAKSKPGRNSSEYIVWLAMRARCTNPKRPDYGRYGGRGIKVCARWYNSFDNFFFDVGPRPSAGYSLERKNNRLGYSVANCIWATAQDQANNRRSNRWITLGRRTLSCAQWSRETGVKASTIIARLAAGWSVKKTLTTTIEARMKKDEP